MRTNLKVPYEEKDDAKSFGARWDAARKTWYVENVENIAQFMRWMPNEVGLDSDCSDFGGADEGWSALLQN